LSPCREATSTGHPSSKESSRWKAAWVISVVWGGKLDEKIDITLIPCFMPGNRSKNTDILYPESFCKGEYLVTFYREDLIQVHLSFPCIMDKRQGDMNALTG
jgi:hypothetical protein